MWSIAEAFNNRPAVEYAEPWVMLVVDDDQEVHAITKLVLCDLVFRNRPLEVLSAHTAESARQQLQERSDIAVVLLDVVMETDDAGLRLTRQIRDEMHNFAVRIILRTGQPGLAPERDIILRYDINDYKEKSELTAEKLYTSTVSALRAYSDITMLDHMLRENERQRTQLKVSEERYRVIVQSQSECVCQLNEDFTLNFANPAFANFTGAAARSLVGRSFIECLNPTESEELLQVLKLLMAGGEVRSVRTKSVRSSGTHWFLWTIDRLQNEQGRRELLLVGRDITDQLIAEQSALQSAKLAALGEMTTGIAHELNQPLAAIALTAQALEQALESERAETGTLIEKMKWIYENAQRMRHITDQLRAFGRKADEQETIFDAAQCVHAAAALMQAPFKLRNIQVEIDVAETSVPVNGNPILFEQVLINLLGNAADAIEQRAETEADCPRTAHITLTMDSAARKAMCRIRDTGPGIPQEMRNLVFDHFFTTKPAGKGTGMGLSLSREIVRKMDGEIAIEDSDEGAAFLICLPLRGEKEKIKETSATSE